MATVTTNCGVLYGGKSTTDSGFSYYEFLNVPYAKAPLGYLRFKSPQPLDPWTGVRDATTINKNNLSMQMDIQKGTVTGTEDCLYLNIFTPKFQDGDSKLLPVMMYIHGGGFFCGNGIVKDEVGPDYLVENEVVLVTINYRLNIFGFLTLDIPEAAGNMGLKDQVQALKWIQNNIKNFGGDPSNVTIFGISAGSASVEYLLLSPLSKGLFHKAIMQSGSSLNHWAINYEPKSFLKLLLLEMGFKGAIEDANSVYQYLFTSDASYLIETTQKVVDKFTSHRIFFGFVPTIEKNLSNNDVFITEHPYKILKEGNFHKVPVVKGFCNKEGYLTNIMKPMAILNLLDKKNFINHFPYEIEEKEKLNSSLSSVYSENEQTNEQDEIGVEFFGDYDFISGIWIGGNVMADLNVTVYFYEMSYDGSLNFFKRLFGLIRKGAAHGDDLTYVFKHPLSKFGDDRDFAVRSNITKMWTNFAKTGTPTTPESEIQWPAFTTAAPVYLNIDEKPILKFDYEPKKMAVFKEIYDKFMK